MSKGLLLNESTYNLSRTFGFEDHFVKKDTALWTTVATDSGTSTIASKRGGILELAASDGTATDNDEIYHHTPEIFKFEAGKAIRFEVAYSLVEAADNVANVFFGLLSDVAADAIVDNGAGLKAGSASGVGFIKRDGQSVLEIVAADGTARRVKALNPSAAFPRRLDAVLGASASNQVLRLDVVPTVGKKANITFYVNDVPVEKFLDFTFDNAVEMSAVIGLKAGSAAAQVLNIDYISCYQTL